MRFFYALFVLSLSKNPIMTTEPSTLEKLHSETAIMCWHDLQPYFAKGSVMRVDESLDLVRVAVDFAEDNIARLEPKIKAELIAPPDNDLARHWYKNNTEFWTVVVAPFVLIQISAQD